MNAFSQSTTARTNNNNSSLAHALADYYSHCIGTNNSCDVAETQFRPSQFGNEEVFGTTIVPPFHRLTITQQQQQPPLAPADDVLIPRYFVEVMSPNWWALAFIVLAAVAAHSFYNHEAPRLSTRRFATCMLAVTVAGVVPFLMYLPDKKPWTGSCMQPKQKSKIEMLHVPLLFMWAAIAMLLVALVRSERRGWRELHMRVGRFALRYLLPAILLELGCNAAWVFLQDKPKVMAQGLWPEVGVEPTAADMVLACVCGMAAMLTPLSIAMYWYLTLTSLHDTRRVPERADRILIHKVYASLAIIVTFSTGLDRWVFLGTFHATGCPMYVSDIISVRVQQQATSYLGLVLVPAASLLYATVPMRLRFGPARRGLEVSFWLYFLHIGLQVLSSYVFNVSFAFKCDPDTVGSIPLSDMCMA